MDTKSMLHINRASTDNEKAASRGFDPSKNMRCIFHSPDQHPSMSLTPDGRTVHCFACGHTADYSKQGW